MQINMGNFGAIVAKPQQEIRVPNDNQTSVALGNLANAGMQLSQTFKSIDEEKQKMQAATQLANLNNDLYDIHDAVNKDVEQGIIKPEDAITEYNKRADEAKQTRTQGMNQFQLDNVNLGVTRTSGALTRNIQNVAIKRTQDDIGAGLMQSGEAFQRQAMRDLPGSIDQYNAAVDTMGPKAGWSPVQIEKAKQSFKEGATYNFSNNVLEGAAQTGDISLIRAAREKIEGPDGEAIAPAKRTALITKAYAYENGITASNIRDQEKAQREAEARENKAHAAYSDAMDLMLTGRYFSQDYINQTSAIVAGTSSAPAFQELVKSQADVAGFASLPMNKQAQILEQRRSTGSDKSIGTDPQQEKITNYMQRIYDTGVQGYKTNPWQTAQDRGVIKNAPTFSANNLEQVGSVLGQRMAEIYTVEAAAGHKISPLQPDEAGQVAKLLKTLPPDQSATFLSQIGGVIGDNERLSALANQFKDKDESLYLAMLLTGDKTEDGRLAGEMVLRGSRALKDNTVAVDTQKEIGWKAQIAQEIGDAYTNQNQREAAIKSAYLAMVGSTAEGNSINAKDAVKLVSGTIVKHNNKKIPLPRGMSERDFNKQLRTFPQDQISTQAPDGKVYSKGVGIPVDQFLKQLPNAGLTQSEMPGVYNVNTGTGFITNQNGQRIMIKVGQ